MANSELEGSPQRSARPFVFLTRRRLIVLLHVAALLLLSAVVFHNNRAFLFFGFDGAYFKILIEQQNTWTPTSLHLTSNPLQGMGNVILPVNFKISPAFMIPRLLFDQELVPVAIYSMLAVELFLGVLFLARSVGLRWATSLASAWCAPLLLLPYFAPMPMYSISMIAPQFIEMMAIAAVMIGLFARLGRGSLPKTVGICAALVALIVFSAAMNPTSHVLTGPVVGVACTCLLVFAADSRERRRKLVCAGLTIAALLPTVIPFVAGTILYSVPTFFKNELENDRVHLIFVSVLFHLTFPYGGPLIVLAGARGAIENLRSPRRSVAGLAAGTLSLTGLIVGCGLAITYLIPDYHGPSPLYFEFIVWPLQIIFAVWAVRRDGRRLIALLFRYVPITQNWYRLPAYVARPIGAGALGAVVLLLAPAQHEREELAGAYIFREPVKNLLVDELARKTAAGPGLRYRGSVATFTNYANDRQGATWGQQAGFDFHCTLHVQNDMRSLGLWTHDIPTLFEYNQVITPAYYFMMSRMLARPCDHQHRNVFLFTELRHRYLESLGVRYVLTDHPVPEQYGWNLVNSLEVPARQPVHLYELPQANLGHFSPTQITVSEDAAETLSVLQNRTFDFRTMAVCDVPIAEELTPAYDTQLTLSRRGLVVSGKSDGSSLLLLPIQYSHCLDLDSLEDSDGSVKLVRLNGLQAGLLFKRQAHVCIELALGPVHNPYGRLRDFLDMRRLNLAATSRDSSESETLSSN